MKLPMPPRIDVQKVQREADGIQEIYPIDSEASLLNYIVSDKEIVIYTPANGLMRMPKGLAKAMALEILEICEVWDED